MWIWLVLLALLLLLLLRRQQPPAEAGECLPAVIPRSGQYVWPLNPMRSFPDFGFMDPDYPRAFGFHTGVDLNHPGGGNIDLGQPIHAITDGQVVAILRNIAPGWGNIVVIWHPGPGVWGRYAHLQHIAVTRCQVVRAGQVIGTVGRGYNNRWLAHLHLDIIIKRPGRWTDWPGFDRGRLLQHYVDPWAFLQRQERAGRITWPPRWEGGRHAAA